MNTIRPIAMNIAGFDPCGGAGLLADIKTLEQHQVYGLGVMTANTIQDESQVDEVEWQPLDSIIRQMDKLLKRYEVQYVKIGIIENEEVLAAVKERLKAHNANIRIVWDPVLQSSSGFSFFKHVESTERLLADIFLLTPNLPEYETLFADEKEALKYSCRCHIYLKGGHHQEETGTDYLLTQGLKRTYTTHAKGIEAKHGSGCVLSSAITASLAKGEALDTACRSGKHYTEQFLASHPSLLGWHKQSI